MERDELLRLLRAFEAEGLEYVLIGATAMGLHGVIRATEDVEGIRVCVATPRALYRMKRATVRPLDRRDAAMLAERFGLKDGD